MLFYPDVTEFKNIIIAVSLDGYVILVGGEQVWELKHYLGEDINDFLPWDKEDLTEKKNNGFPIRAGVYRCTIEYHFEQGYFEGYTCDSESSWDVYATNIERVIPEDKHKGISPDCLSEPGGDDDILESWDGELKIRENG